MSHDRYPIIQSEEQRFFFEKRSKKLSEVFGSFFKKNRFRPTVGVPVRTLPGQSYCFSVKGAV
jgi:hypothetical protein